MPPGTTTFCRQAKVGKSWLRGGAPKYPNFWIRVVEGFILETMSVEGVPTNPGSFSSTPAGRVGTSYASLVSA